VCRLFTDRDDPAGRDQRTPAAVAERAQLPAEDAFRLITAGRRFNAGIMLGDAARYLAVGLAIGLAAAWPTARMFESLLFGLRATDTGVCVTAAVVVLVARRAGRSDDRAAAGIGPQTP